MLCSDEIYWGKRYGNKNVKMILGKMPLCSDEICWGKRYGNKNVKMILWKK